MTKREYMIQAGDTFYGLAQRWGGTCAEWQRTNPGVNPQALQIGQVIILPEISGLRGEDRPSGRGQLGSVGQVVDEVEMEVEGVIFRVRRQGESRVPHEVQLIIPRTEIRKVQQAGDICELQIMLSNVNIVHSPRLTSGDKGQVPIGEKDSKGSTAPETGSDYFRSQ